MELKFYLKSKTPGAPGTVNMRFAPVVGAAENEEFIGEASGELVLDNVKEDTVADMIVPTEDERTGLMNNPMPMASPARIPSGKPVIPYQEYVLTLTKT